MSNSLYNPFLFSAFLDRRTFKEDDPGPSNNDNDDKPAVQTNQDRINEIHAASDNPWETHGAELNSLVNDRSGTYSGESTTATAASSNDNDNQPALSASAQSKVGNVAQDDNGDWYATVQIEGTNALGRDYSIDPKDNSQGPTFGYNVSEDIETLFPDEVEASGGSADYTGSIKDTFKDTDVDSTGFDASTGTYTYEAAEPETFGDAFAKNRAAGNATFVYNGEVYTTDLALDAPAAVDTGIGSLRPVSRPTNLLSSEEQALVDAYNAVPDSDESYTPDAATMAAVLKSQNKESVITDPLSVAEQVASYGGVDLDAQDAATTAANNAAAATALGSDDFSYTILDKGQGGLGSSPLPDDNVVADLSGYANLSQEDFLSEAGSGRDACNVQQCVRRRVYLQNRCCAF